MIQSQLFLLRDNNFIHGALSGACTMMVDEQIQSYKISASVIHFSREREPARFNTLLLKVKRLKNMRNLNTFPLKYLSMKEDK